MTLDQNSALLAVASSPYRMRKYWKLGSSIATSASLTNFLCSEIVRSISAGRVLGSISIDGERVVLRRAV